MRSPRTWARMGPHGMGAPQGACCAVSAKRALVLDRGRRARKAGNRGPRQPPQATRPAPYTGRLWRPRCRRRVQTRGDEDEREGKQQEQGGKKDEKRRGATGTSAPAWAGRAAWPAHNVQECPRRERRDETIKKGQGEARRLACVARSCGVASTMSSSSCTSLATTGVPGSTLATMSLRGETRESSCSGTQ